MGIDGGERPPRVTLNWGTVLYPTLTSIFSVIFSRQRKIDTDQPSIAVGYEVSDCYYLEGFTLLH